MLQKIISMKNLWNSLTHISASEFEFTKTSEPDVIHVVKKIIGEQKMSFEIKKAAEEVGAVSFEADVTKENDMMRLADFATEKFGRIDIWVNNAGLMRPGGLIEKTNWDYVRDMMEVNLFGIMYGSKAAFVQMKKQKTGVIVNILSTSSLEGHVEALGYCASKHAAVGFVRAFRLETEPLGIKIISVYPGGMKTNLFDERGRSQNYNIFMEPSNVARKIIENLKKENPEEELILRRPKV